MTYNIGKWHMAMRRLKLRLERGKPARSDKEGTIMFCLRSWNTESMGKTEGSVRSGKIVGSRAIDGRSLGLVGQKEKAYEWGR